MPVAESIRWRGRDATRLSNGLVEMTALTQGGHLADFRFSSQTGAPSDNVLWESPWMVPGHAGSQQDEQSETGGFTGHALCLDYFGAPTPEDDAAGLPIHGEAGSARWDAQELSVAADAACRWTVHLPVAQLDFERIIRLQDQETVVYVEETVYNRREADHPCQWVEHATFSPPFLNHAESTLAVSATLGITSPTEYEGGSLLAVNQEFSWPYAPRATAVGSTVDLRQPFSSEGFGFGAAVELDPRRDVEFLAAMNWKLRLGVGYCFRRTDFPWMALWEENCARPGPPWNGSTQARGMEFGTTPFGAGRDEARRGGNIFGTPIGCVIPAHGKKTARYLIFLFAIPDGIQSIEDVEIMGDAIVLYDERVKSSFAVPAAGCKDFLDN